MNRYIKLAKENDPCIVVIPRTEEVNGEMMIYGLTVIAESRENIGHSHGLYTRYDYGFMQLDVENGINVFVVSN